MKSWRGCEGLLDLFSVPASEGRERFCDLVDMGALLVRFETVYGVGDLERAIMREKGWSPLVFWSCIKRAVRPLLQAGGETLRALGVPVEGEPATAHDLAVAIAAAVAEEIGDEDRAVALDVSTHIGRVLNGR